MAAVAASISWVHVVPEVLTGHTQPWPDNPLPVANLHFFTLGQGVEAITQQTCRSGEELGVSVSARTYLCIYWLWLDSYTHHGYFLLMAKLASQDM